jgi:uncharacterized protein (DUF1697 family)
MVAMRYLALLRGINVGTSGRIRMDALKRLLEEAGFSDVATYIQSGNVLFCSDQTEAAAKASIERALKDGAAITTTAILRTQQEFTQILQNCPFSPDEIARAQAKNTEAESLYVCLLPQKPDDSLRDSLTALDTGGDAFAMIGREVYLLLSQSIRTSKLAIRLQKQVPDMTVRNWKTMENLLALMQATMPSEGGLV